MMRRAISVVCALGLAAGVVVVTASGASAYPPGTALTVTATPSPVGVGRVVTATARHVKPGCSVVFALGSRTVTVHTASTAAAGRLVAPAAAGTRTLSATTTGCGLVERAYTRVVVVGATVTAPATVKRQVVFAVTARKFPASSVVVVRLTKGTIAVVQRARTNSAGTVTMYFRLSRTGTYLVTAVSGTVHATDSVRVI